MASVMDALKQLFHICLSFCERSFQTERCLANQLQIDHFLSANHLIITNGDRDTWSAFKDRTDTYGVIRVWLKRKI